MSKKIMLSYLLTTDRIQKFQIPGYSYPVSVGKGHDSPPRLFVHANITWDVEGYEYRELDLDDTRELTLMVVRTDEPHDDRDIVNHLGSFVFDNTHQEFHVFIARDELVATNP